MERVARGALVAAVAGVLAGCGAPAKPDAGVDAGPGQPLSCVIARDDEPNDDPAARGVVKLKLPEDRASSRTETGCLVKGDTDVALVEAAQVPRVLTLSVSRARFPGGSGTFLLLTASDGGSALGLAADAGEGSGSVWAVVPPAAGVPLVLRGAGADAEGGYEFTVESAPLLETTPFSRGADDAPDWLPPAPLRFQAARLVDAPATFGLGPCDTVDAGQAWVKTSLDAGAHALMKLVQPQGLRFTLSVRAGGAEVARLTDRSTVLEDAFDLPDGGDVFVVFTPGAQSRCGTGTAPSASTSSLEAWVR